MNNLYNVYLITTIALLLAWVKNLPPIAKNKWLEFLCSVLPFAFIPWCANNLIEQADIANQVKPNSGWIYILWYFSYISILVIISHKSYKYLNNKYWSNNK